MRSRGVAAVAILSLAVGISANATIFSLVHALEFPDLVYPDPSRIVLLESRNLVRGISGMLVSVPDAIDLLSSARTFSVASVTADQSSVLREARGGGRVAGRRVTAAFFQVMGVSPSLGRTLTAEDQPGTIVLSDSTWRTHYGRDSRIVGRAVRLDGGVVTVVGVMPPRFDADADFWVPFTPSADSSREDRQFTVFARLAPFASLMDATRELEAISQYLAEREPGTNRNWEMYPIPVTRMHGRDSRESFLLLQAAVGFVLLIACANIANILLARGAARGHEMALRISLGATRGRLLSASLAESLTLGVAGGALGLLLAMWGIRLARAIGGFPDVIEPSLNPSVVTFTAAVSILTGVLSGLVPAVRASRVAPTLVLKDGGRGSVATAGGRLRAALVAVQIAFALVLATSGTLVLRSLMNRQEVQLGFDPRGGVRADIALPPDRYTDAASLRRTTDALLESLQRQPGITSAGASTWALPTPAGGQRALTLPGSGDVALPLSVRRAIEAVTPGYFQALGVPLRSGRAFTRADREGARPVAIVNDELARHLWRDRSPVGETVRIGTPDEGGPIVTVVGVVATVRRSAMHDTPVARVYVPYAHYPNGALSVVVRTRDRTAAAMSQLTHVVAQTDPDLFLEGLRTVEADVAQFLAPVRMMATLLGAFGVAGVLLAGLGVFGTVSYTVSQREREMAVRAALGATRRDIVRLAVASTLRMTAAGMIVGAIAASMAARMLAGVLFGVSTADPVSWATVALALSVVSLGACWRPARRAANMDPMALLRRP